MKLTLSIAIAFLLAGCASSNSGSGSMKENAVVHSATQADLAATADKTPLAGDRATLYVNGLGCPQCAYNADIQLKRVKGVGEVATDLSTGTITVGLFGKERPSAYALGEAVKDAGFTLVKVESR